MWLLKNKIKFTLFLIFYFFLISGLCAAPSSEEIKVENVIFRISYTKIVVEYDLIGPADKQYEVTLLLKREINDTFNYVPINVTGDIRKGISSGKKRQIVWDISKEFPDWFDAKNKDYYFVVNVYLEGKGISPLIWIGGGAALLGGGAAILLFKKDNSGGQNPVVKLPNPPDIRNKP
jgi:hypothetical protein